MFMMWALILMAVWFAMYAIKALTNIEVVAFNAIHGVVAAACSILLIMAVFKG